MLFLKFQYFNPSGSIKLVQAYVGIIDWGSVLGWTIDMCYTRYFKARVKKAELCTADHAPTWIAASQSLH